MRLQKNTQIPFCFQQSSPGKLRKPGGTKVIQRGRPPHAGTGGSAYQINISLSALSVTALPRWRALPYFASTLGCGENKELMQIFLMRRSIEVILFSIKLKWAYPRALVTWPITETHTQCSLGASKTLGLFYWQDLTYLWDTTVQGCLFLARVEQKLPLMWSFHNPPSFIHQGMNTHAKTDSNQNTVFSLLVCFVF